MPELLGSPAMRTVPARAWNRTATRKCSCYDRLPVGASGQAKEIMGYCQEAKAQDFDSCIRRFESGYPSLGVAAPRNHMACFLYSFSFLNPLAES